MQELPTYVTSTGEARINAIDFHPNRIYKDTYRWAAGAIMPAEFLMFDVPQNQIGSGYAVAKDIGETNLQQERCFPFAFSFWSIHIEWFTEAAYYSALLNFEYLMHLMRETTIEIKRAGAILDLPETHTSRLPSSNGLNPKFSNATDTSYVTNGFIGVNDFVALPEDIAYGVGETIEVTIRRNPNDAVLALAAPGAAPNCYYCQIGLRGNIIRQPQ
ncbi:MAG: hypothetical protein ABII90_03650 [Bacteroidota bacterium]